MMRAALCPLMNGGVKIISRQLGAFSPSRTNTSPVTGCTRTPVHFVIWFAPLPPYWVVNELWPNTRLAVFAPAGKRSTRLLPLSATHKLVTASTSTPAEKTPIVVPYSHWRFREEAEGVPGRERFVKLTWPQTSSAMPSVAKGSLNLSTRLLQRSAT